MPTRTSLAHVIVACGLSLSVGHPASAGTIDGAWASPGDACAKVFVRSKKGISFAKDADMYGSGFIIGGDRIRGKIASCKINLRKQEGATLNLVAACSSDVAVETVQFTLNIIGDNKVTRVYSGLPELNTRYDRCQL